MPREEPVKERSTIMKKKIVLFIFIIGSISVLMGCNASKGLGKDVENTGKNIQETVDKNQ